MSPHSATLAPQIPASPSSVAAPPPVHQDQHRPRLNPHRTARIPPPPPPQSNPPSLNDWIDDLMSLPTGDELLPQKLRMSCFHDAGADAEASFLAELGKPMTVMDITQMYEEALSRLPVADMPEISACVVRCGHCIGLLNLAMLAKLLVPLNKDHAMPPAVVLEKGASFLGVVLHLLPAPLRRRSSFAPLVVLNSPPLLLLQTCKSAMSLSSLIGRPSWCCMLSPIHASIHIHSRIPTTYLDIDIVTEHAVYLFDLLRTARRSPVLTVLCFFTNLLSQGEDPCWEQQAA